MQPGWFSLMLKASESGLLPKRARLTLLQQICASSI
jgi:hypothetical protein